MKGDIKVFYGGADLFTDICPAPFVFFEKEYIKTSSSWGSKYFIKFEGQIVTKPCPQGLSFYTLESKKDELIGKFDRDNLSIEIFEDSVSIFKSDICQIESISFEESKYFGILPFTVSLVCYDKQSFASNYGVTNPQDSWEYSENEDGTLSLRHAVSAEGFNTSPSAGSIDSAILNAKNWVSSKTGISKRIVPVNYGSLTDSSFMLDSFSEQIDRFNGTYSVEETYRADLLRTNASGSGILRYTVEISKDLERGITDVSIQGSVVGKTSFGLADMTQLRNKMNAENFFNIAASYALIATGANKINNVPYSRSVTESPNKSEISFSFRYDDDPVPPGQAKCVYSVEMSENLIKNIVDIKLNADIFCERGDASIRWQAVEDYYSNTFNARYLAGVEYAAAGYSKSFPQVPSSESLTFDEFNARINYSASWSNRYMPYPDILTFISEKVEVSPALQVYVVQPSYYNNGIHNVQDFGTAKRSSVSIKIEAVCRPDKTIAQLRTCVLNELARIKARYVVGANAFTDEKRETVDENNRKMSISYSYSFDGDIIS